MSRSGRELQITVCWSAGWTIYLSGELDAASASQLDRIGAALAGARIAAADFDLSGVTFIDNAGWDNLAAAMNAVEASGALARATHPSPSVRRLLEILGAFQTVDGRGANRPHLATIA
jgi:anti-anti-sigma factor